MGERTRISAKVGFTEYVQTQRGARHNPSIASPRNQSDLQPKRHPNAVDLWYAKCSRCQLFQNDGPTQSGLSAHKQPRASQLILRVTRHTHLLLLIRGICEGEVGCPRNTNSGNKRLNSMSQSTEGINRIIHASTHNLKLQWHESKVDNLHSRPQDVVRLQGRHVDILKLLC